MGMIAKILKKKAGQLKDAFTIPANREEQIDYPLNLRMDATVRIDPTVFILAGESLKIQCPEGDSIVSAIGHFKLFKAQYYRFYLKTLEEEERYLQLAVENGNVSECILYRTIDEVFPGPGEWSVWLNRSTGLIGYRDFHTPDQTNYQRVFMAEGADYINPMAYQETVTAKGVRFTIGHEAMLYGRFVETGGDPLAEYLAVSKEEDDEGALIRIAAGVEVNPVSLTIL